MGASTRHVRTFNHKTCASYSTRTFIALEHIFGELRNRASRAAAKNVVDVEGTSKAYNFHTITPF